MSTLKLHCCFPQNMTLIPNEFLDHYMPSANGEFVKVYLLLIRMSASGETFALSDAADMLSCTEKDILRALRYWEKAGLLSLKQDAEGNLTGVECVSASGTLPEAKEKSPKQAESREEAGADVPRRKQLTAERIMQLEDTEDFMYLLFVSGQYLGRNLTRTDIDTLGYFYDELHMSVDLIEYLIEYCVSNSHTGIRYIETVGLAWHSEGIKTVEEAKKTQGLHHKDYYTIFKSLGIKGHSPISAEIQIMDKWMNTYRFTMDMIQEACTRTVMRTAKPTLAYADGILTRWFRENIRTLEDVKQEDEAHRKDHVKDRKSPSPRKGKNPAGTFYNFEQRSYDSGLENQLLGITGNEDT